MTEKGTILLIYDKECPACNNYCQVVRIRKEIGELVLVDARDESDELREITERYWDIDQRMVLKMGEELYYGSNAKHALALISSRSGIFNGIIFCVFKSKTISKRDTFRMEDSVWFLGAEFAYRWTTDAYLNLMI